MPIHQYSPSYFGHFSLSIVPPFHPNHINVVLWINCCNTGKLAIQEASSSLSVLIQDDHACKRCQQRKTGVLALAMR